MKHLVLAVKPCLVRDLLPEIKKAAEEIARKRWARNTALASDVTFEACLQMHSLDASAIAEVLRAPGFTRAMAQSLESPEVLIADKSIWWEER